MKETFYFSHDYHARTDEKIIELLSKEGWEGYGLFWAIVEKLYENEGYIDKEYERIAYDLRTQSERIQRIIEDYGLFQSAGKKITSKSIEHRLRLRKGKSEQARQSAKKRWDTVKQGNANALRTQSDGNAIKERKGKERKVNETNTTIVVTEQALKPDNRNQDIQKLIYHIKEFCTSRSIIYDSTDERNFAKHITTAKDFGEISDKLGKTRIEMALSIIELAESDKFWRGKICGPKSIYQNRAKILNSGRATYMNQTQNPDVLVI